MNGQVQESWRENPGHGRTLLKSRVASCGTHLFPTWRQPPVLLRPHSHECQAVVASPTAVNEFPTLPLHTGHRSARRGMLHQLAAAVKQPAARNTRELRRSPPGTAAAAPPSYSHVISQSPVQLGSAPSTRFHPGELSRCLPWRRASRDGVDLSETISPGASSARIRARFNPAIPVCRLGPDSGPPKRPTSIVSPWIGRCKTSIAALRVPASRALRLSIDGGVVFPPQTAVFPQFPAAEGFPLNSAPEPRRLRSNAFSKAGSAPRRALRHPLPGRSCTPRSAPPSSEPSCKAARSIAALA